MSSVRSWLHRKATMNGIACAAVLICASHILGRFHDAEKLLIFFRRGQILCYDFVDTYWPMGRAMLTGVTPVDGYYYSPAFALFLRLFAAESVDVATARWVALLLSFTVLSAALGFKFLRHRAGSPGPLIFLVLNFSSYYFYNNLFWGQVSELAFVFVLASAYLQFRGRTNASAVALAIICAVKYFFGLFVLQYVIRARWRSLPVFAITWVTLMFVVPALVIGPHATIEFFRLIRVNMAHDLALYAIDPSDQFPLFVARRWVTGAWAGSLVAAAVCVFTAVAAGRTLWVAWAWPAADRFGQTIRTTGALLLVLPCLTPTAWEHYFYALPFVQAGLIGELRADGTRRPAWRTRVVWALMTASILLSNILPMIWMRRFSATIDPWWDVPLDQAKYGLPLIANLLLLAALTFLDEPVSTKIPAV